jgi:ADP-ribose pyrophosphatase
MEIQNRKRVYEGYCKVNELHLKDGGIQIVREQVERPDAVAALLHDKTNGKIILVRQWRPGPETETIEAVAGVIDPGEADPKQAMKREIMEETGYEVDKLTFVKKICTTPGFCTEKLYLYYAEAGKKSGKGGGIEDENIQLVKIPEHEFGDYPIEDAKTSILQLWYKLKPSEK